MKYPTYHAKAFASDSRATKRPLGNDLSDRMADRIGPGWRCNYDCANDQRFTTYKWYRDTLLELACEARDLVETRGSSPEHEVPLVISGRDS